ncbi:MAG: hypothetical protein JO214_14040 [Frankiaceae bacterium]|nr:hypothetical protein [Frankiaceae bacterium]
MPKMTSYKISYQRREVDGGQVIKGSVIYKTRHISEAIDNTIAELKADEDTASFVILDAKEVAAA